LSKSCLTFEWGQMLGARTPSDARGYRIDGDADAGGRVPSASVTY